MEIKSEFDSLIDRLIAANNAIGDGYEAGPRLIKNLHTIWAGKEYELRERVELLEALVAERSIETDENGLSKSDYQNDITFPNG